MTASELTELAARVEAGSGALTDHDLYYLRSIYGQLRETRKERQQLIAEEGYGLSDEALANNLDWLDCFIDQHTRALAAQQQDRQTEG